MDTGGQEYRKERQKNAGGVWGGPEDVCVQKYIPVSCATHAKCFPNRRAPRLHHPTYQRTYNTPTHSPWSLTAKSPNTAKVNGRLDRAPGLGIQFVKFNTV